MICGTFTRTNLTKPMADMAVQLFKLHTPPPTSVTETADGTGTYTVVATWPPCPADTTHAAGAA
jgi:hypothetical protein